MRLTLEIPAAPDGPQAYAIEPGRETRVGRSAPSEIVLSWDPALSRQHFAVACDGQSCRLRDLKSTHGTVVNETPADEAGLELKDGDQVTAGGTLFRVHLRETLGSGASDGEPIPPAAEALRALKEPLYAVLDAARDPLVLGLLMQSGERFQSLYEGPKAQRYAGIAPYLVALPKDSQFLVQLVRMGWGKSWGIFLACTRPFEEVRKHLRHFLTVQLEGGKSVLFRFYDPRVLRPFLPTCKGPELAAFFGPLKGLFAEAGMPEGAVLGFTLESSGRLLRSDLAADQLGGGTPCESSPGTRV
ncbi:MAG: DUF4123 domain-containing protein [Isosphaeraceae bacterium]